MPDEASLRAQACRVLQSRKLPRRDPDRTWRGHGVGSPCIICEKPIARDQVAYELQFVHGGATPGLDKFPLHQRCFAAWEFERAKTDRSRGPSGMAASGNSVSDDIRQPFSLAGPIAYWNLTTRELIILGRELVLVPHLSTAGLETSRRVVVAGYHDAIAGRMVVTRLHLE
jgi:hypothetical protein